MDFEQPLSINSFRNKKKYVFTFIGNPKNLWGENMKIQKTKFAMHFWTTLFHIQTNMHTYTPNHLLNPYSKVLVKMILKDYISILFYASN